MVNPVSEVFKVIVWKRASELYKEEFKAALREAPVAVQEQYKEKSRKELREYLAAFGIV